MADPRILQVMSPSGIQPIEDVDENDEGTSSTAGGNPGPNNTMFARGNPGADQLVWVNLTYGAKGYVRIEPDPTVKEEARGNPGDRPAIKDTRPDETSEGNLGPGPAPKVARTSLVGPVSPEKANLRKEVQSLFLGIHRGRE